jgi:hypothetical protein
LWWIKWYWSRFSPSTSVSSPTAAHSSSSIIRRWKETINSYKFIVKKNRPMKDHLDHLGVGRTVVQGRHKLSHSSEQSTRSETALRQRCALVTQGSNRTPGQDIANITPVCPWKANVIQISGAWFGPPEPITCLPPSQPWCPDLTDFFPVRLHQRTMYPPTYREPLMKCEQELLQPLLRWSGWDIVRVIHLYNLKLYGGKCLIQCTLSNAYRPSYLWDTPYDFLKSMTHFRKTCTY